jgi:carbon storage regulator
MLVLTRKQNEKIRIGDSITVTVLRMKGKGVRLGIEAPQDVNVIRGELCFELSEEEAEESEADASTSDAPRGRQPRSTASRETTGHWPRPEQRAQAAAACETVVSSSPLKAMVDARTV